MCRRVSAIFALHRIDQRIEFGDGCAGGRFQRGHTRCQRRAIGRCGGGLRLQRGDRGIQPADKGLKRADCIAPAW
jgi:hypothetical protein